MLGARTEATRRLQDDYQVTKMTRAACPVCQYLKGAYRKAGEGLFTRAWNDRTRGNGFKLSRVDSD